MARTKSKRTMSAAHLAAISDAASRSGSGQREAAARRLLSKAHVGRRERTDVTVLGDAGWGDGVEGCAVVIAVDSRLVPGGGGAVL